MHSLAPVLSAIMIVFACTAMADPLPVAQLWQSSEDGKLQLSAGTALVLVEGNGSNDTRITIDDSLRYQSILGLGASLEHATCENLFKLPEEKRAAVIRSLVHPVDGIGMNLMRVCIGASDFIGEPYYSYNDLPPGQTDLPLAQFSIEKDRAYVLPVIKAAQAANPDLLFFASPWSPPGWMKTGGTLNGGKLRPEFYDVYARYLVKFIQAYAAEGVPMRAITVQNEPQHTDPNYTTTLWTGIEQRDFIQANFGPALRAAGLQTPIWCWDHNWNQPEFPRAVLSTPGAAQYVEGSAWHFYEGKVEAQSQFREEFPDKDIFFTEGSTFGTRGAIQIIEILRNWARSYNAWVIMLDEHRKPNRGPHFASATCIELQDDGSVEYRFDYYMYGQFMKFIPRDAIRIDSGPVEKNFAHVAFLTPDQRIVLVVANADRKDRNLSVAWQGRSLDMQIGGRSVATLSWPTK